MDLHSPQIVKQLVWILPAVLFLLWLGRRIRERRLASFIQDAVLRDRLTGSTSRKLRAISSLTRCSSTLQYLRSNTMESERSARSLSMRWSVINSAGS